MALDRRIARCFNETFARSHGCVMVGGGLEPRYLPGGRAPHRAILRYRENFAASALHEAAHWCIAGRRRRAMVDFGYWYAPPPRTGDLQARFVLVEARAQALERHFSRCIGLPFQPSIDDVSQVDAAALSRFAAAIERAAAQMCAAGLPARARRFADALTGAPWNG
jgi:elongation factor P hydroxylase